MLRPLIYGSILCTLTLLTPLPAACFDELPPHPAGSSAQARGPEQARCPGWDDEENTRHGGIDVRGQNLVELARAVAKDPTDAASCRKLAEALRAVGRADEAKRLEDQAAHISGFCLLRTRKGT